MLCLAPVAVVASLCYFEMARFILRDADAVARDAG
jgi:hypothetical protein